MKLVSLFAYRPLLLERSYGGGGELVWFMLQGLLCLAAIAVVLKLSTRASEVHGERYHTFLKRAGLAAVLFAVVYALASL